MTECPVVAVSELREAGSRVRGGATTARLAPRVRVRHEDESGHAEPDPRGHFETSHHVSSISPDVSATPARDVDTSARVNDCNDGRSGPLRISRICRRSWCAVAGF